MANPRVYALQTNAARSPIDYKRLLYKFHGNKNLLKVKY